MLGWAGLSWRLGGDRYSCMVLAVRGSDLSTLLSQPRRSIPHRQAILGMYARTDGHSQDETHTGLSHRQATGIQTYRHRLKPQGRTPIHRDAP